MHCGVPVRVEKFNEELCVLLCPNQGTNVITGQHAVQQVANRVLKNKIQNNH